MINDPVWFILGEIHSLGGIHIHKICTQICIYFYDLIKEGSETVYGFRIQTLSRDPCNMITAPWVKFVLYLRVCTSERKSKVSTHLRKKGILRNTYTYSNTFEMPPNIP